MTSTVADPLVLDLTDGGPHDPRRPAPPRLVVGIWPALLLAGIALGAFLLSPWALLFLLQVSALIVIHEAGHLVAARRCGMATTEFFVGFGPVVVAFERGGTRWGLKALPIGGYVKIPGMSASEEVAPELEARTYRAARVRHRLVTVLGGPVANLVAAVAIFSVAAFLTAGGADGARTDAAHPAVRTHGVLGAVGDGLELARETTTATLEGFAAFVTAPFGTDTTAAGTEVQNRFLSPVGASQVTEWTAESDPLLWLEFVGLISVSLAVANLLPFPPLDGGHAVVAITEGSLSRVRRRIVVVPKRLTTTIAWATLAFFAFITVGSLVLDLTDPLDNPFSPAPSVGSTEPAG